MTKNPMDIAFLDPSAVDWAPPSIILDLYRNITDSVPEKVDLTEFIADDPDPRYYKSCAPLNDPDKLYFAEEVHDTYSYNNEQGKKVTVRTNIASIINNASCFDNGYELVVFERKKKDWGSVIVLKCRLHSRVTRKTKAIKVHRGSKSAPSTEDVCSFKLHVYYDNVLKRFFIRKNSGACLVHCNHEPVERKHQQATTMNIPKETLDTAIDLFKRNCPTAIVNNVIDTLSKNKLSEGSINHLRRTVLMSKHGNDNNESTAVTLIRLLEQKGAKYSYITGTYSEAKKLVRVYKHTVKKRKGKKKRWKASAEAKAVESIDKLLENETKTTEEIQDPGQEASDYVEAVVKALELGDDEILLGVAWATENGRINHQAYPNILGIDVTFGTNNEKRPLFRVTGKNARGNIIPFAEAFLPSQQRYVFRWLFAEALPQLLDAKALACTTLILTDQDPHMIEALMGVLLETRKLYGLALHRLCKWHKVNRNYQLKMKPLAITEEDKAFVEEMRDWLYAFTSAIEYESEEKDYMKVLRMTIKSERSNEKINNKLLDETLDYIKTGFEDQLYRLCHRRYMHVLGGGTADNSFSESGNSSLARDATGPKPKHRLHVAVDCILEHDEARYNSLTTSAIGELKTRHMKRPNETEAESLSRSLSARIIEEKNSGAVEQYVLSKQYTCLKVEDIGDIDESLLIGSSKHFFCRDLKVYDQQYKHRRPVYSRTRVITAREVTICEEEYVFFHCSCGFFFHHLYPCRHIYSCLERAPVPSDFMPACFKTYELAYARDPVYTEKCDGILQHVMLNGGMMTKGSLLNVNPRVSEKGVTWFKDTLHCLQNMNSRCVSSVAVGSGADADDGDVDFGSSGGFDESSLEYATNTKGNMTAYSRHIPIFQTIMDNVQTEEQHLLVSRMFKEMHIGVMRLGVPKSAKKRSAPTSFTPDDKTDSTRKTGMASLNSIDKRGQKKRCAPSGSPTKYNK